MSAESMLTELVDATFGELEPVFDQLEWAEDEISRAQRRHPHAAERLHHSFMLIGPTSDRRMNTEFVYRGHARELLDRVARGEDARPGTAAEVVIALCEAGKAAPLIETGYGLVFRMWAEAFPDQQELTDDREHREKLHGSSIDDAETEARAKLAVADRVLGTIECIGWHHGDRVACAYAPQTLPLDLDAAALPAAQGAA